MLIRAATVADLPALQALEAVCNLAPWSASQLQAALCAPNHICVLCQDDAHIAAMLVWQQVVDEAEIHLLDTAPAARRQGCATLLLRHLQQYAAARHWSRILLEVRAGNQAALALYRRCGFVECGHRRGYYGGREDAVLMEYRC